MRRARVRDMVKRRMSVSYIEDIDTLFVHFDLKAGFYDLISEDDDHIWARYDENGKVIGFMIDGLKDLKDLRGFELSDITREEVMRPADPLPEAQRAKDWTVHMSLADDIRQYATIHYIEPARRAGCDTVSIRAGNVHEAMGLIRRVPAVCDAMRAQKFMDMANVKVESITGPKQSTTTTFHCRIL